MGQVGPYRVVILSSRQKDNAQVRQFRAPRRSDAPRRAYEIFCSIRDSHGTTAPWDRWVLIVRTADNKDWSLMGTGATDGAEWTAREVRAVMTAIRWGGLAILPATRSGG